MGLIGGLTANLGSNWIRNPVCSFENWKQNHNWNVFFEELDLNPNCFNLFLEWKLQFLLHKLPSTRVEPPIIKLTHDQTTYD
jgi:hypothetical protein